MRMTGIRVRRGDFFDFIRAQVNPPFPSPRTAASPGKRTILIRRGEVFSFVPAQVNPPFPFPRTYAAPIKRTFLSKRSDRWDVVPPQFNPPFPPPFTFHRTAHKRSIIARRGDFFSFVPTQQTAPVNPDIVFPPVTSRHHRTLLPRRGRRWDAAPPQVNPPRIFPPYSSRHHRTILPRRGYRWDAAPAQVAPPANPAIVFRRDQRLRVRGWVVRQTRGRTTFTFIPAQILAGPYPFPVIRARLRPRAKPQARHGLFVFPLGIHIDVPRLVIEPIRGVLVTDGRMTGILVTDGMTTGVLVTDGKTTTVLLS